MPNHIKNIVTFKGKPEDVAAVKAAIQGHNEDREGKLNDIDFNTLIKQPEGLEENGGWYDWRVDNWGTKWNAYDSEPNDNENEINFLTAWGCPFPIYRQISLKFGDKVSFTVKYADEDLGYNCGTITFESKGGLPTLWNPKEGSQEARQFAADLWGWSLEDEEETD